jgi:hypothetical protein
MLEWVGYNALLDSDNSATKDKVGLGRKRAGEEHERYGYGTACPHGPNENKMSDRRRERARIALKRL